ncbi:hypothetical protein QQ045_024358 [Rhodiola kirilowii]
MKAMFKDRFVNVTVGLDKRVEDARGNLLNIQMSVHDNPSDESLLSLETEETKEFKKLKRYQMIFYQQRTKMQWVKDGDVNSKFFHSVIKGRRSRNNIKAVRLSDGSISSEKNRIHSVFSNYFQSLLGLSVDPDSVCKVTISSGKLVEDDWCRGLIREATDAEIWKALNAIGVDKSPGPDGFSASFFKSNWNLIGNELCNSIRHCFRHNTLPKGLNSTPLALIPKHNSAMHPEEYRHISCCNVVYKIISGVLARRLKELMPEIINQAQGAFVKGRSIVGNVSVAQQLMAGYGRKNISERVAWKIDLRKAYDTVCWDFLDAMLHELKFPLKFISWVKMCVRSPSFSVLINGEFVNYFEGKRGLPQGNPLSPFLFLIAMEYLSRLLNRLDRKAWFYYHPKCHRIGLKHILFADDLFLFSSGRSSSIIAMKDCVEKFLRSSGLSINLAKSRVFVAGMPDSKKV